ncbi:hypothetical protein BJV85_004047 [Clostridium acetobutylicum]|nr:hypothetical protein [Clostridium acetobutylicum]
MIVFVVSSLLLLKIKKFLKDVDKLAENDIIYKLSSAANN